MSFQGPLICLALVTPEALLGTKCSAQGGRALGTKCSAQGGRALGTKCLVLSCLVLLHKRCISVNFFLRFLGLRGICLCANVLNFEYQHLFIACKNWLCGYETWMKALFSWKKNRLYSSQCSPRNTGNLILGLRNSNIFWGSTPPDPPRRRGLTAPCWYSRLLYPNLLATSIIIETPGNYYSAMQPILPCFLPLTAIVTPK